MKLKVIWEYNFVNVKKGKNRRENNDKYTYRFSHRSEASIY